MKKKTARPDIMDLARANAALVESQRNRLGDLPDNLELAAFMATFHPEVKGKKLRSLLK